MQWSHSSPHLILIINDSPMVMTCKMGWNTIVILFKTLKLFFQNDFGKQTILKNFKDIFQVLFQIILHIYEVYKW